MRPLKKIPAIPLRKEDDPNHEPEIWQPHWCCFCCEDTGIAKWAAHLFIEGYEMGRQKYPVCQNPGCEAGERFGSGPSLQESLDWRLEPAMCQEADMWNRENWRQTRQQQHQYRQRVREVAEQLASSKSLRKRERTQREQMEAQRKHQEARAQ